MSKRDSVIELLKQYANVTVSTNKEKYIELLGPNESKEMQKYFCDPKTSGCALTIRGLWRQLGINDPFLLPNYKFGTAISGLVQLARKKKAWKSSNINELPGVGDLVLVGGDKVKDGGVEHVFTVVTVTTNSDNTISLTSIDGGQLDSKGQQAIFEKNRRWQIRNGSYWDISKAGSDPGSDAKGGRRVIGWANIENIL